MMPNSRMIPPNNIEKQQLSRSTSMAGDHTFKKGFISRLLATPTPPIPKEYNQPIYTNTKPKYESVLGMDEYNQWNQPHSSSSTSSIKTSSGFTKLFKKKEKIQEDEEDDLPKVRPVNQRLSKSHSKIPLAPPPQPRTRAISQPDLHHILASLPPEFPNQKIAPMPVIPDRPRTPTSIRKSTGSYSIYSTFGASDDDEAVAEESSSDEDDFVDATGVSQEEIEKELAANEALAKRLSGGHYGSAGGLLSSIERSDDELAKSMLNWKRQSDGNKRWSAFKADVVAEDLLSMPDKLVMREQAEKALSGNRIPEQLPPPQSQELPSPPQKLLQTLTTELSKNVWNSELHLLDDPKMKLNESIEQTDDVKETAQKLWEEDETTISKEKMAEWLGQPKPFESAVLEEYMQHFEFSDMRLDNAFRKLCSKLYFKAEAQQIDRILESFAHRYWQCNLDCIFGSADIVYAVVYSLLLLNTDLHVAQGNHARMTRSEFIRNTMSTVRDQQVNLADRTFEIEQYLKEMYLSVKHYQILQPLASQQESLKRTSLLGSRRVEGLKRSVGSIMRKSGRESMFVPDPIVKSPRRDSFSSSNSSVASGSMIHYMHTSSLFSSEPPYYKEGVVMRKHLLENANQKARHREWRECLLEVGAEGELRMYGLQPAFSDKTLFRNSSATDVFHPRSSKQIQSYNGGGQWASHSQLIGKINLNHTLSNPLPPPGYNRHRPHVFALQQSDGGVYLFQVVSAEQAQEWVSTFNYWAARESKEPLPGAISNMEYGWGNCLDDVIMDLDTYQEGQGYTSLVDPDSVAITDWIPPQPTMVSSTLDEKEQYIALQKHLRKLNNDINEHRDLKSKILIKFPSKSNNYSKVLNNWEARSKYLLHDIIKYQHYCDALEKSIEKSNKQEPQQTHHLEDQQEKLIFKSSTVNLFEEINQELSLQL